MQLESRERPIITRGYAVLNYGSKPNTPIFPPATQPFLLPNTSTSFLDYELRPLNQSDVDDFPTAEEVTRRVVMKLHQRVLPGQGGQIIWLENAYSWTDKIPQEPYLVSLYKDDGVEFPSLARALDNNGVDNKTGAFPAEIGEVIEIILQNTGADFGGVDVHPWHAHGAHYYDIGSGNGTYNPEANEKKLKGTSPVKRDTTMLYRYITATGNGTDAGWRAWRLRITEPGVWMIHCHILQHMIM
jgi:L-ascorbate oxidase